jgi:PKD repeat protein
MKNTSDEVALSEVVGFVLLLGLIVATLSLYMVYVVPVSGREAEISQMDRINEQFTDYKFTLDNIRTSVQVNNLSPVMTSTSFNLGTGGGNTLASGLFLYMLQPASSTATLAINTTGDTFDIDSSSYHSIHDSNGEFPISITSLEYRSNNNYGIQQRYSYQLGGVFLSQDDGVTNRISPLISFSRSANDSVVVHIVPVQLVGGGSLSGNGPAQVNTRQRVLPKYNISTDPYLANTWVNLSFTSADNQTAAMWLNIFKDTAIREQLSASAYTTGSVWNPVSKRTTVFIYISGTNPDPNWKDVSLYVKRADFYVALNSIAPELVIPPTPTPSTTITVTPTATTTTTVTTTTTPVLPLPVIANFNGTPRSGFAPLSVQFTDASTGPVTGWLWSFGDGNSSSLQNPQYTYPGTGDWPVSLTVTNGSGSNTLTRTQYITVNTPASGNIILNAGKDAYLESGGEMQFRVTGGSSFIQINGVTYTLNPSDTVRLVVENNEYGSIYSTSAYISEFSFNDVSFYQNGAYVNRGAVGSINVNGFDQYQSTLNLFMPSASVWTSFSVDGISLINGVSSAAIRITGLSSPMNLGPASPSNVYYSGSAAGYQILGPQVTGITPGSGVAGTTVSITDLSGMYFEMGSTPTVKLQNGASTITATSVSVVSPVRIQCTFSLAGAATGLWDVVVVNPDGQSGTGTGLFTVTPGPLTASFTYTLPSSTVVHLTDTSTGGATTWDWDFGDGTPHSMVQNPPDHTYTSGGTYTVKLTVTDGGVRSSSTQQAIPIFIPATHTTTLSASKGAYIESGGVMQFHVTGASSSIQINGVTYTLNSGDTIRFVMENNEYGSIYSTSSAITTFSFGDVSFYQNNVYINRGSVASLYVSGYDQYQSTLNLYMPSASAQTYFVFDGTTLINYEVSSAAIRITGLSNPMNLGPASPSSVYYVGSAAGYQM